MLKHLQGVNRITFEYFKTITRDLVFFNLNNCFYIYRKSYFKEMEKKREERPKTLLSTFVQSVLWFWFIWLCSRLMLASVFAIEKCAAIKSNQIMLKQGAVIVKCNITNCYIANHHHHHHHYRSFVFNRQLNISIGMSCTFCFCALSIAQWKWVMHSLQSSIKMPF